MKVYSKIMKCFSQSKKQYLLSIIIYMLFFSLLLILVNIEQSVNLMIEKNIKNKYSNRDIFVDLGKDEDINNFQEISKYVDIYYKYLKPLNTLDQNNQSIILSGANNQELPKLKVNQIKKTNSNYFIIPSNYNNQNTNDLLGKEIVLNYNNEYYFNGTVAGVYEVSNKDNQSIKFYTSIESYEKFILDNHIYKFNNQFHLIAKDQKYTQIIIEKLNLKGYRAFLNDSSLKLELNMYEGLQKTLNDFILLVFIFIIIVFAIFIGTIIHKEINTVALLKSLGYNEKQIQINLLMILIIPIFISYLMSNLIYLITNQIIKNLFDYNFLKYFTFDFKINLIILFIVIIILFLILILYTFKIKNISIIKLIGDNK